MCNTKKDIVVICVIAGLWSSSQLMPFSASAGELARGTQNDMTAFPSFSLLCRAMSDLTTVYDAKKTSVEELQSLQSHQIRSHPMFRLDFEGGNSVFLAMTRADGSEIDWELGIARFGEAETMISFVSPNGKPSGSISVHYPTKSGAMIASSDVISVDIENYVKETEYSGRGQTVTHYLCANNNGNNL